MKKVMLLFAIVFLAQSLMAQQEKKECACCSEPYTMFDFWIGNWTVYDVNGKIVGTNTIEKQHDNCVLQEKWVSKSKNRGTSYNYYDKTDNTWNQIWIDNSGFSLALKGNYAEDKMILRSELVDSEKGNYHNQITWVKNDDNSVTQIWDIFDENGKKLQELLRGIYKKSVN